MRPVWRLLVSIGILAFAGCGPKTDGGTVGRHGTTAPTGKSLKVAMVTDTGGIDDQSFNAEAWDGLKRAATDLGVTKRFLESKEQADYKTNLSSLADQKN